MNYTHEMEKAMHHAHGIGYVVYCQKREERMKVENRREQEYSQSRKIAENFAKKQHHN
ncbi:hypothetical protein [Niallia oryzisoli]|uniref:hypothetical protein n=1 Tax=Niallia oryzisoli TaxID=1737571 RepID=UPI003736E9A3